MSSIRRIKEDDKCSLENLVTVEYSISQGCCHVATLREVLEKNAQNVLRQQPNDFLLIAICHDHADAERVCREVHATADNEAYWRRLEDGYQDMGDEYPEGDW